MSPAGGPPPGARINSTPEDDPEADLILGGEPEPAAGMGHGDDAPPSAERPAPGELLEDEDDLVLGGPTELERDVRVPDHVPRDALDDAALGLERTRLGRARIALRTALRRGVRRVRGSFAALLVTGLMCGAAFWLSRELLGQPYPMVAPVLVWVALGIYRDRPPRRVAELGLGATLGVAVGEVLASLFGYGLWQFVVITLVAGILGRMLDSAELFTSQLVLQAMFMATMPSAMIQGGPLGRWAEALLGCVLAIIASSFLRRDVGRRPRSLGAAALADLAAVLDRTAAAWRTGTPAAAADALALGRASQGPLGEWAAAARTSRDIVRVNPALRARRRELEDEVHAATMTDRAMRNARIVARLSVGAIEEDGAHPVVADHIQRLAAATRMLAHNHRLSASTNAPRAVLESVSGQLSPSRDGLGGWRTRMVESLLRSLAVDLMQVSGASNREAVSHLAR